jgi:hypothetical protein
MRRNTIAVPLERAFLVSLSSQSRRGPRFGRSFARRRQLGLPDYLSQSSSLTNLRIEWQIGCGLACIHSCSRLRPTANKTKPAVASTPSPIPRMCLNCQTTAPTIAKATPNMKLSVVSALDKVNVARMDELPPSATEIFTGLAPSDSDIVHPALSRLYT